LIINQSFICLPGIQTAKTCTHK